MVRIRLYIEKRGEGPGLYYGKNRKHICDDKWLLSISSSVKSGNVRSPSPMWRHMYSNDRAKTKDDHYALDINKFAVLT